MTVEVRSLHRRVRLDSAPAEGWTEQILLVPIGSTDAQVLGWARECLPPDAFAELEARIAVEAT